jgi:tetratricopeptide (TPR) repeat protein
MQKKFFFHVLLIVLPFIASTQTTAKDWYKKGVELINKQDYENALAAFKNSISKDAKYNDAYYGAGWCSTELEKFEDAVDYLNKYAPVSNETKKKKCNQLGAAYLSLQNSKDAIEQFNQTLLISPTDGIALRGIGDAYYGIEEDHDSAITYYEKAIKADEQNSKPIYYKLAWLYNDGERYDDAINMLLKAIQYDSEDSGLREELGFAYYMKEEYEFAITQLNKAISLDAESKLGYYYKGLCFVATNKKGEAMSMYYKLKELGTEEAAVLLEKINSMK